MESSNIVCLPGASGNVTAFENLVNSLNREPRPIVLDYPGLGASQRRNDVDSLDELYQYVLARLPATECTLMAMSMGCSLALRAALESPNRIRKLVLIALSGGIDVSRFGAEDWREDWSARRPTAPRWFIDDRSDYGPRLATITIPTLLLFGDADPIAPRAVGEYLCEQMPSARLEVLAGATHDLLEERATELAPLIEQHVNA